VERIEEGWKKRRENGRKKREFIDARMDVLIKLLFVPHSPVFYIWFLYINLSEIFNWMINVV
jgi:hypothetical protein